MLREEIARINLGNSLDKLSNIDPRGYGVCNILYAAAREYTKYPLTMNAAERLAVKLEKGSLVYIITGFVLPSHKKAETDGIVSSMLLARALVKAFGAKPVIICPEENMPAVENLSAVAGLHLYSSIAEMLKYDASVCAAVFPKDAQSAEKLAESLCENYAPDAVISIEAPGPNSRGVYHNATGLNVTELEAKSDILFSRLRKSGTLNIAVCDLGNEIGMGTLRRHIGKYVPYAGEGACACGCGGGIACDVEADNIITATVSDWGCAGMIAALAYITDDIDVLQDEELARDAIIAASRSGMVDMTGWLVPAVDGVDCSVNVRIVGLMRDMVRCTMKYRGSGNNWFSGVDSLGFFSSEFDFSCASGIGNCYV